MAIVFRSHNAADAHRVKGLLDAHGIPAEVANEMLSTARGELPLDLSTMITVWIADASRAEEARRLIEEHETPADGPPWTCPSCDEPRDSAFTACWKCGAERPAAP